MYYLFVESAHSSGVGLQISGLGKPGLYKVLDDGYPLT